MMRHSFLIRSADGSDREETDDMWLRNDQAALAFSNDVIRDIARQRRSIRLLDDGHCRRASAPLLRSVSVSLRRSPAALSRTT
jgi:hypothetical protein